MTIHSGMLVALGFLSACLLSLVFAHALWKRAVRLTAVRIKARMPLTQSEILADKDQMRAEFAIQIRKYEVSLEKEKMNAARQLVEISHCETNIKNLESQIETLERDLEGQKNANRVYEQTITQRIPKMEAQLQKARELLGERYQEISSLRTTIDRQESKLGKAQTMDQMRKAEVDRLRSAYILSDHDKPDEHSNMVLHADLHKVEEQNQELKKELDELRLKLNGQHPGHTGQDDESASDASSGTGEDAEDLLDDTLPSLSQEENAQNNKPKSKDETARDTLEEPSKQATDNADTATVAEADRETNEDNDTAATSRSQRRGFSERLRSLTGGS